jgi:uncharacterized lipoprotein YmbA
MNKHYLALVLVITSVLAGCSGSAPLHTQYLLRSEGSGDTVKSTAPARVGIGRVMIAPYLDRSGLIIETDGGIIRPARYHQWAEPLEISLLLYLRAETSKALGEPVGLNPADSDRWDFTVDVFVEEFHGTVAGEALLVATFRITQSGETEPTDYRFSKRAPLAEEGYPAMVDAEAGLARDLAAAIAAALQAQISAAR